MDLTKPQQDHLDQYTMLALKPRYIKVRDDLITWSWLYDNMGSGDKYLEVALITPDGESYYEKLFSPTEKDLRDCMERLIKESKK